MAKLPNLHVEQKQQPLAKEKPCRPVEGSRDQRHRPKVHPRRRKDSNREAERAKKQQIAKYIGRINSIVRFGRHRIAHLSPAWFSMLVRSNLPPALQLFLSNDFGWEASFAPHLQIAANERSQISVKNALHVANLDTCSKVFDHPVGLHHIAA